MFSLLKKCVYALHVYVDKYTCMYVLGMNTWGFHAKLAVRKPCNF